MGKLSYDLYIQHFSHEHPLELSNLQPHQQLQPSLACSACNEPLSSGWIYSCKPCKYILHISCAQLPKVINHPSDPNHQLILLPTPAHGGNFFDCNACGHQGSTGFSYHCSACSLDIHVQCVSKPLETIHQSHLHPLYLAFHPPYETNCFSCDICHKLGSNHWLYRCGLCGFDAHLGCATTTINNQIRFGQQLQPHPQQQAQPVLQQHYSFPGANHQSQIMPQGVLMNNNQPLHQQFRHVNNTRNMGAGQMVAQQQPYNQQQLVRNMGVGQMAMPQQAYNQQQLVGNMGAQMVMPQQGYNQQQLVGNMGGQMVMPQQAYNQQQIGNMGVEQMVMTQQPYNQQQQGGSNDIMGIAVQGFVNGAAQQAGQDFVQNINGGGNTDNSGNGNDNNNNNTSSGLAGIARLMFGF